MKRLVILIVGWFAGVGLLACGLALLLFFGGRLESPLPPRDTVQGTVVDHDSGAPLSGASVACTSGYPLSFFEHRDEVKTDAQGRFTLPIQYKDYFIEVRKRGYMSRKFYRMLREDLHTQMHVIGLTRRAGG